MSSADSPSFSFSVACTSISVSTPKPLSFSTSRVLATTLSKSAPVVDVLIAMDIRFPSSVASSITDTHRGIEHFLADLVAPVVAQSVQGAAPLASMMDSMNLPVRPPVDPMLARAADTVPDRPGAWSYEPKWDGFRTLVFRDGDEVMLQSRNGKPLGRYFPELVDALRAGRPSSRSGPAARHPSSPS